MCEEAILKLSMPRTKKTHVHLKALFQHVPLFQSRSKKLGFFLVSPESLTELFGSFWFNRCIIGNACCDDCGSSSRLATTLVAELLDFQEESFDSPELLPLSRFKSCFAFSGYIASLKETKTNFVIKERSEAHASISQRSITNNSL